MKRWIALNKIEFLLTKRQLVYYLLSVGMPTAFYLFFSGMYQETPGGPASFMRDYLISMTAFSMMSTPSKPSPAASKPSAAAKPTGRSLILSKPKSAARPKPLKNA